MAFTINQSKYSPDLKTHVFALSVHLFPPVLGKAGREITPVPLPARWIFMGRLTPTCWITGIAKSIELKKLAKKKDLRLGEKPNMHSPL